MHLLASIQMKAAGDYSKQIQSNKITSLLIAVQTYRIGGVFFLWGMTQGFLDPAFSIPAGIGDILIGVTAIPFAILLWKGYSWSKYAVVVWSVLGIADLVNAITLGQITSSGPTISTMLNFPLILFPTMPVLAALAMHIITLYRLRRYVPIQEHLKLSSKNASFAEKKKEA
jgi:hypothetical protein